METYKRYLISTAETFFAWFIATFLLQIEGIINAWTMPTKEILMSITIASVFAWTKAILKYLRELYLIK